MTRLERNFWEYKYYIGYNFSILGNNFIVRIIHIFHVIFLFPEIPFKTPLTGNENNGFGRTAFLASKKYHFGSKFFRLR